MASNTSIFWLVHAFVTSRAGAHVAPDFLDYVEKPTGERDEEKEKATGKAAYRKVPHGLSKVAQLILAPWRAGKVRGA